MVDSDSINLGYDGDWSYITTDNQSVNNGTLSQTVTSGADFFYTFIGEFYDDVGFAIIMVCRYPNTGVWSGATSGQWEDLCPGPYDLFYRRSASRNIYCTQSHE